MGRLEDLVKAGRAIREAEAADEKRKKAERAIVNRKVAIANMEKLLADLGVEAPISYEQANNGENGEAVARFNFEGHEIVVDSGCNKELYRFTIDRGDELCVNGSMDVVKKMADILGRMEPTSEYW